MLGVTECCVVGLGLERGHDEVGLGQAGGERIPGGGHRLGDETLEAAFTFHSLCEGV